YFHKEGIAATRAEILAVCSAYGYHPLSLSLLVGLINEDHEKRGDIAAVKNLEIFEDVKARRHHVLERAYGSLAPERRDLLSRISCFRGSMEYAVLKKVFPSPDLDKALLDLRKRGLLQYAGETQRYDMHPIVRHYAYDHFTDEKRRKEAHIELAMHFIDAMPVTNKNVKTLEDLAPVIELYHHMVRAGNLDEAIKLFRDRLASQLLYQFGAYQLRIELLRALFLDGEDKPPRLKDEAWQGWTLNGLANSYSLSGQPRRAVPPYTSAIALAEKVGNKTNLAVGLGAISEMVLFPTGALSTAEHNLRRQIDLCVEIDDKLDESNGHHQLSRVLVYCGNWKKSEQEQDIAQQMFEKENHVQGQGVVWSYSALRFLLMAREAVVSGQSSIVHCQSSIQCAQRALELAEGGDPNIGGAVVPRDLVGSHWLLGSACRMNGDLTLAEENLSKVLNLCRQINMVDHEADILLDIARLRYAQNDFKDAQEKASEALTITERSGYVLQGADVNLFLAELALTLPSPEGRGESARETAKKYAEEAKRLATCEGAEYKYKVAYEEAERFLEDLK
ncbi:MAG TPA: tetratricopeptide repeat protein, partial [Anaerolineales bacterium]|nr:tetratricopeptide repeat protein [Anaerolineales bacterium]